MSNIEKKVAVVALVVLMTVSALAVVSMFVQATGAITLTASPGEKAKGGGWPAGGWITAADFDDEDPVHEFTLIVENSGKDDITDLRIAMAIHGPLDPDFQTTADDFVSIEIDGDDVAIHYLGDFGSTEENVFDDSFGGKHQVYVGEDAIWDIAYISTVIPGKTTVNLNVVVTLGPDPSDDFEIHFDAWAPLNNYKTPNGHDLNFMSSARLPDEDEYPPVAVICGGDKTVNEGDLVHFVGCCSFDTNPDGSGYIVSYEWDMDSNVDSDGDGNAGNDVDLTGPQVDWIWYDDYECDVGLTVTDNDGLTDKAWVHVTVLNVAPTLDFEGAFIEFELFIRVAGEKWHNVELSVVTDYGTQDEEEIGHMEVERWPGPPDENPSIGDAIPISMQIGEEAPLYTAIVTYDPEADVGDLIMGDQPINGQLWGANPVWLIAQFEDGTVCKKHHTFNVQQSMERDSDHWNHVEPWIVPINIGPAVGVPIKFMASATDPGTDDLTFEWDWGDLTVDSNLYLYDPVRGPDPAYPPVDPLYDPLGSPYEPLGAPWDPWYVSYVGATPPLYVPDTTYHTYWMAGTFTVTLTVYDDDGGEATYSFDIEVSDSFC